MQIASEAEKLAIVIVEFFWLGSLGGATPIGQMVGKQLRGLDELDHWNSLDMFGSELVTFSVSKSKHQKSDHLPNDLFLQCEPLIRS